MSSSSAASASNGPRLPLDLVGHGLDLLAHRWLEARPEVAAVVRLVEAGDVTHPVLGQEVVAALHLLHRPGEGVGRLLRVDHHRGEEVGQPLY